MPRAQPAMNVGNESSIASPGFLPAPGNTMSTTSRTTVSSIALVAANSTPLAIPNATRPRNGRT